MFGSTSIALELSYVFITIIGSLVLLYAFGRWWEGRD